MRVFWPFWDTLGQNLSSRCPGSILRVSKLNNLTRGGSDLFARSCINKLICYYTLPPFLIGCMLGIDSRSVLRATMLRKWWPSSDSYETRRNWHWGYSRVRAYGCVHIVAYVIVVFLGLISKLSFVYLVPVDRKLVSGNRSAIVANTPSLIPRCALALAH